MKTKATVVGENASTSQPIAGEQPSCVRMPKDNAAPTVDAPQSGSVSVEPGMNKRLLAEAVRSKTNPFHVTVKFENTGVAGS